VVVSIDRLRLTAALAVLAVAAFLVPAAAQPVQEPRVAASASALATLPGNLPLRRGEASGPQDTSWVSVLLLFGLLLAAAAVVVHRRSAKGLLQSWKTLWPAASCVERLSSQALTTHASIHAVRWNDEELLLGCTPQQVTVLARRPAACAGGDRS
jgi:flagellar biogenesis protein FliO